MNEGNKTLWVAAIVSTIGGFFLLLSVVAGVLLHVRFQSPAVVPSPQPVVALGWVDKIPADARPFVAAFYRDLSAVIEVTNAVQTKDQFRTAHAIATQVLDVAEGDPDLAPVSEDVSKYFIQAIGVEPGPLPKDTLVPALKLLADAIHADPA